MERSITIILLWCLLQGAAGQDWTVFVPLSVEFLEGSCVRIPCRFTVPWHYDQYLDSSCKALWYSGQRGTLVFDSSLLEYQNIFKGQLEGNLQSKDCTTIFNNVPVRQPKLFFRLECYYVKTNFPNGVTIKVKDVWEPALDQGDDVDIQEGKTLRLSCSARIPCPLKPPTLSWRPSFEDAHEKTLVQDGVVTSVLTFNASSLHHGEKIICSSLYKRQRGHSNVLFERHLTLNVMYPPANVWVEWPSSPVLEGSYTHLNCNGSANPPADSFTWYRSRRNPGMDHGNQEPLGFNQSINVSVSEDTQFFCEVRNPFGAKNTSLTQIDVHFPPKKVELRVEPSGEVLEGLGFTLSCSNRARPPASHYAWYWASGGAPGSRVLLPDHGANLTVERAGRRHGGRYHCVAGNHLGQNESDPFHLDIHFAAEILNSSYCVRLSSRVRCFCESQGFPVPSLAWQLAGEAVNHSAQWKIKEFQVDNLEIISVISLAQSDEDPPTLVCLSNNSVGIDRLELNLASSEIQRAFNAVSLLIGWTAGSVVMVLLCTLSYLILCRKKSHQVPEGTDHGNTSELPLVQVEQQDVVYADAKYVLDEGGKEEELHYVDLSFTMLHSLLAADPEVDFVRGMDSKTAEYAQIGPRHAGSGEGEPQEEEVYAECISCVQTGASEVMDEGSLKDAEDSGIVL